MNLKTLAVPAATFLLAVLLSMTLGPSRQALSLRPAAAATGCLAACGMTSAQQNISSLVAPGKPADLDSTGEIVETVNATTGNVGSVTASTSGWSLDVISDPAGSQGGGGARVRARLAIGGSSATTARVIIYGNGTLPAMHTINGSAQVRVSGLETCATLKGNLNWSLASFAVYISPRGSTRAIVADTTVTGWSCAAQ